MSEQTSAPDGAERIAALEKENAELRKLLAGATEGYSDAWIAEQVKRTVMLTGDEDLMKVFRIFGNRVLMEFGDREGMHQAFAEAHARDHAEPAPESATGTPREDLLNGWTLEVTQNDFETQLCLYGPEKDQDAFFAVPRDSAYAEVLRSFAGTLERIPVQGDWQDIRHAPTDQLLLLAYEMDGPGDWRMKVGGYWDGHWHVFGASWKPTRFMHLPAAPAGSDKAPHQEVSVSGS
jgi:hypothetical protein